MEVLEYTQKPTTLDIFRKVINTGTIEKVTFCGVGLITCLTNNIFGKICLSIVFLRKLYKIYKNNKLEINTLFDNII